MFVYYTMPIVDIIEKKSLGETHLSSMYSHKRVRSKQASAYENIVGVYEGSVKGFLLGSKISFIEIVLNEDLSYGIKVFEESKRFLKTTEPPLLKYKFFKTSDTSYLHDADGEQLQINVQSDRLITIVNKADKFVRYLEKMVYVNEDDLNASNDVQSGTSVNDPVTYFNYVSATYEEKLTSAFQDRHRNPVRGTSKYNGGDEYAAAHGGDSVMPTTPAEYQKIKADLMNGVIRTNKVTKVNHVKCATPAGIGEGVLDERTFTCFVESGDLPYVPMCQGEQVHIKGLDLSNETFLVSVNNYRSVPVPSIPSRYENEENRLNANYMSLELPIVIDETNDFMIFNFGKIVNDEHAFVDENDKLLVDDMKIELPATAHGTYTSQYDLSKVIRANFEDGVHFQRFQGMTTDENSPYYIRRQNKLNFITRQTPLAKLLGLNGKALLPNSIKFDNTGDAKMIGNYIGYSTNALGGFRKDTPELVLSDDGKYSGFSSFETFTPLSASVIKKFDDFANGTLEANVTIEVQHGPINNTSMLKDPQGYRNWVACVVELYKAATFEVHATLIPWAKKEGNNVVVLSSWDDVKAFGDKYGSDVYSETANYYIEWGAAHINDFSSRVPNGYLRPPRPVPYRNDHRAALVPLYNAFWYSEGKKQTFGTEANRLITDTLVDSYEADLGTDYLPSWSSDDTTGVEVDLVNYCDDPVTFFWVLEGAIQVLQPFRRFQAPPDGAKEVSGNFRAGVIKKSIVKRILNLDDNVPDAEVPNYGYFRMNEHNARGGHAGVGYKGGLNANQVSGPSIMKYFNEMKCTRVITDNRGCLGGGPTVLSLYDTYGTYRLRNTQDSYGSSDTRPNRFVFSRPDTKSVYENATGEEGVDPSFRGYNPSMIANVFPEGLFDRDPERYPDIDESLNPNPTNTKKRHMFLHCGDSISMSQYQFFEHKQLDEEGNSYYRLATEDEDNTLGYVALPPEDQTVENMTYGSCNRPFCTGGNYPMTQDDPISKYNPNKDETETFAIQPLRLTRRRENDPLTKHSNGCSVGQWGKQYQPDFLPDYAAMTFMQDIGFTTDLLTDPVFEAQGGVEEFGTPIYPPATLNDASSDTYIPAPEVMPDFFNPLTYRDRMLERTIWMMNQEDWREHKSDQSWSTSNF